MDFQDKKLICKECSQEFIWSAGEQKFYADKGLQNPPGRCPECRRIKKDQKANQPKYKIICKNCGKEGEVNFPPRDPNDILCTDCFRQQRAKEAETKT